ncbi:glycoside hydrolase family 88 protein [Alkalihalobacillus pseudalcaliphilus]|uniref:glycoside hydrolase family 88 protein n=1 Tax=Alkalihalobacillus pseudalcaliphilus TaxID=79884 RepID=UPI00064DF130|nr:glycoside hydrolase family 88 protein [Alkalihalobacillus pseudalcaliphilus]KMK75031.1 hypothetical protein AB990_16305 [Alkalihalobacillus pseudalcaliphilus]
MTYIVFLLVILGIAVILTDVLPIFRDWLSRIHIGRFHNENQWMVAAKAIAVKWLTHTPKMKVTDQTRFVILDILKGNYSKATIQHWQEAALLFGLSSYLEFNNNQEVQTKINEYVNKTFDSEGQWVKKPQHVDAAILAYAVMKINFIKVEKYQKAFDYIWELIQEHIGRDGTVGYRKSMMDYRYVDTIGFICPFLVAYGVHFKKAECVDLAITQIKEFDLYGMMQSLYIPCHAYHVSNKIPIGLYGWGRGMAWYVIGLMDAWLELPQSHMHKAYLGERIERLAESALQTQQDNGSWTWLMTRKEVRADSSVTAVMAWFLLNCSKVNSPVQPNHNLAANKALSYLRTVTKKNGEVDFSQGDTKDIGVYSQLFNIMPFTQGFTLRAYFIRNKS